MKFFNDELMKFKNLNMSKESPSKFVHFYTTNQGYKAIDPPKLFDEMVCPHCGNTEGLSFALGNDEYAWFCKLICKPSELPKEPQGNNTPLKTFRALQWPLLCEISGIGDIHHDVRFELIEQSAEKLDYLRNYSRNPKGIVLMRGPTGTGKTYACMGLCELFSRTNDSVLFFSNKSLTNKWLATFKEECPSGFIKKIEQVSLLVIDDFGTTDPSSAFLSFFMELIDSRLQWSNRGTVISTNLSMKKMSDVCGEYLSNRMSTGKVFTFSGPSRRTKRIF